jgi:hypothetical protein
MNTLLNTQQTLPPSLMHAFPTHLVWQWGLVIIILALAVYILVQIGQEKVVYEKEAITQPFHSLMITYPKWWTPTKVDPGFIHFERTDTHYAWFASVQSLPQTSDSAVECIWSWLQEHRIEIDELSETTQANYIIKDKILCEHINSFYRLESTGTEDNIERTYLDICCFSLKNNEHYLLISKSSVLNGCLEGPFFEELLSRLTLQTNAAALL